MLLIAIAGLAMGGGIWGYRMWRLSDEYEVQARRHRTLALVYGHPEQVVPGSVAAAMGTSDDLRRQDLKKRVERLGAESREEAEQYAKKADYYWAVVRKYERAARYPWLPVEPDPPEP